MKLTAKQINVIEQALVLKGIRFDDVKLELTDHIASEIEEVMEINTLSFEENSKIVFEKWSEDLRLSNCFLTAARRYPKIILDKKKAVLKRQLFIGFLISMFSFFLFLGLTQYYNSQLIFNYFQTGVHFLFAVGCLFLIVCTLKIRKSKLNTSFNEDSNRRAISVLSWIFTIYLFPIPETIGDQVLTFVIQPLALFHVLINIRLIMKHIQFEKKLTNI